MAYISISGGTYSGRMLGANRPYVAPAFVGNGPNVPAAAAVKKAVDVPVMVAGNIADVAYAESVVAEGKADIVGMVRGLIADPKILVKAFNGQENQITPCIGCNECHYGVTVRCSVNPAVGQEAAFEAAPVIKTKNVLVIGAGPAGMECALSAARRGHHVTLADRSPGLGGMLSLLARTSEQSRFGDYLTYMKRVLDEASVDVKLNTSVDAEYVKWLAPDVAVVATGATYEALPERTVNAAVALESPKQLGVRVAVAGGLDDHLPSLVVADYLSRHGYRVTLLSENPLPGQTVEPASLYMMLRRFAERGVDLRPLTAAVKLEDGNLLTRNSFSNAPGRIEGIDSLVVADGRKPVNGLAAQLKDVVGKVHVIGDALAPRRMLHATIDGVRLGQTEL